MMPSVWFATVLALYSQYMSSIIEGASVSPPPKVTGETQAINMTFLVHTLNQAFNPSGRCVEQSNDSNAREEVTVTIRNEMETLAAGLYEKIEQVCPRNKSSPSKIHLEDAQMLAGIIKESFNKTTGELEWAIEKTFEKCHRSLQEVLTNLETRVMEKIREATEGSWRVLDKIDTLSLLLNTSDSIWGSTNFFYSSDASACGSYYSFDLVLRNWTEARSYCTNRGWDLVSIETSGENEFLKQILLRNKEHPSIKALNRRIGGWAGFWTSGSDKDREGTWVWKATGSPVTYKNWSPREPNNAGKMEHYINIVAGTGKWNDGKDSYTQYPLCEKSLLC